MRYNVKIESEPIGDKESLYLSITHNGSVWASIRIVNPDVEIPQIIDVLQRYLTNAMHSDGEGRGEKQYDALKEAVRRSDPFAV